MQSVNRCNGLHSLPDGRSNENSHVYSREPWTYSRTTRVTFGRPLCPRVTPANSAFQADLELKFERVPGLRSRRANA